MNKRSCKRSELEKSGQACTKMLQMNKLHPKYLEHMPLKWTEAMKSEDTMMQTVQWHLKVLGKQDMGKQDISWPRFTLVKPYMWRSQEPTENRPLVGGPAQYLAIF